MIKKLFSSKLEKFIFKKVLILCFVLTILALLLFQYRLQVIAGLVLGGLVSVKRLSVDVSTFSKLLSESGAKYATRISVLQYIAYSAANLIVLAVSLKINQWLFFGVVAGILLVPAVIIINGITEALGITHNNFE